MYSGSTLKPLKYFDAWFGAHQKLDRTAYRKLRMSLPAEDRQYLPSIRQIVQFEGFDGPDGIKRKTPAQEELWHYYDPYDPKDTQIFAIIDGQFDNLVAALREGNKTRAGFEAAWLAHGIVDGMTPAHHYPYEAELVRLRGGQSIETRTTPKEKLLMPGDTILQKLRNNWQMWGDKGLLATHIAFELGVAVTLLPMRMPSVKLDDKLCEQVMAEGHLELFKRSAKEIADLHMYDIFYQSGWTPRLVKLIRSELAPRIVLAVSLTWYEALMRAKRS